jgi:hypothetical protein
MWESGIAHFLMLLLVPVSIVAGQPQAPAGGFGETLEQAKQTGFFKWFMLEQTSESTEGSGKQFVFQPSGDRFHNFARVNVKVDGQGRIVGVELALQREFVDSASIGIYARDIAKSFLQTGVNPQDQESVANLVREIDQLKGSSAPVIIHQDAVKPSPAGPPSDGYEVYLGRREGFQQALPHGQSLSLENKTATNTGSGDKSAATKILSISYRARG